MAKGRISETERLRREVSFLRSTLREIEGYTAAETDGVLAHKSGQSRESNPFDHTQDTTRWLSWSCGWDSEDHNLAMRTVIDRLNTFLPELERTLGNKQFRDLPRLRPLLESLADFQRVLRGSDIKILKEIHPVEVTG